MITNLELGEFKAFHRESIPLRSITILVGENNSGKSSLLAAIRLLAQTVQSDDPTIPLALSGPFGDFGSYRDIVHGHHRGRPITLGLTVDAHPRGRSIGPHSFLSEFKYRTQRRATILRSTKLSSAGRPLITVSASRELDRMVVASVGSRTVPDAARASLRGSVRIVHFLPRIWPEFLSEGSKSPDVLRTLANLRQVRRDAFKAFDAIVATLRGLEFVGE